MSLLDLWLYKDHWDSERKKQAEEIFGTAYRGIHSRTMATLNRKGTQLRIWFASPEVFDSLDHVDSNGKGLLIHIHGTPEQAAMYLREYLKLLGAKIENSEIAVPNGAKLYIPWTSR